MTHERTDDQDPVAADGETIELTLAAEAASVPAARHYVNERWSDLDEDTLSDVALVVTELVANAVRHGAPDIRLRLRANPFAVDVSVLDHGPGWPVRRAAHEVDGQGYGRGLAIVEQLAERWGAEPAADGDGKVVWASVARPTD